MLNVGKIEEGIVLDHIEAGKAMLIYHYLKLDREEYPVAIIKNARSEAMGKKDGRDVRVESHLFAPGFAESFEKFGVTGEQYLTGQGGYLFSKLLLNDAFAGQSGMISSDMLSDAQVDEYFRYAAELGITLETKVRKAWEILDQ